MTPQALATGLGREGYKFFPNHFLGSLGHRSSPSIRSSHGTRERERDQSPRGFTKEIRPC